MIPFHQSSRSKSFTEPIMMYNMIRQRDCKLKHTITEICNIHVDGDLGVRLNLHQWQQLPPGQFNMFSSVILLASTNQCWLPQFFLVLCLSKISFLASRIEKVHSHFLFSEFALFCTKGKLLKDKILLEFHYTQDFMFLCMFHYVGWHVNM